MLPPLLRTAHAQASTLQAWLWPPSASAGGVSSGLQALLDRCLRFEEAVHTTTTTTTPTAAAMDSRRLSEFHDMLRTQDRAFGEAFFHSIALLGPAAVARTTCDPDLLRACDGPMLALWVAMLRVRAVAQQIVQVAAHPVPTSSAPQSARPARPPGIVEECSVHEVLVDASNDVGALMTEKLGVCVPVLVEPSPARLRCLPGHLHHLGVELLKNGCTAMHRRHRLDTDTAPPLRVTISAGDGEVGLRFSDSGMYRPIF